MSLSTTAVMECACRSTIPMRQSNCVEKYDERDALYIVYSKLTAGLTCSCEKCFRTDAQRLFRAGRQAGRQSGRQAVRQAGSPS